MVREAAEFIMEKVDYFLAVLAFIVIIEVGVIIRTMLEGNKTCMVCGRDYKDCICFINNLSSRHDDK